jgi:hypothetical protein
MVNISDIVYRLENLCSEATNKITVPAEPETKSLETYSVNASTKIPARAAEPRKQRGDKNAERMISAETRDGIPKNRLRRKSCNKITITQYFADGNHSANAEIVIAVMICFFGEIPPYSAALGLAPTARSS